MRERIDWRELGGRALLAAFFVVMLFGGTFL